MSAETIRLGRTVLGIELGSTRIKACLIDADDPSRVLAVGSHAWENRLEDGNWTYAIEDVWKGLQSAYAAVREEARARYGVVPETYRAIGISAMMHGYFAFDAEGELLTPFRTWRNTSTGQAAAALSRLFDRHIPLRWSIAHLYQALLDDEDHVRDVAFLTTLAGYVHWKLTGRFVLGIGDASGMFPVDAVAHGYDAVMMARARRLFAERMPGLEPAAVLPEVLAAGQPAGALTSEGAALLDPSGSLGEGIPFCPPEGDAGTGMVATDSIRPRTGTVSVGTSVFAMVVLERPLRAAHDEIDLVTTPVGDPVAMVHCNNGAGELAAWVALFTQFSALTGASQDSDTVFGALLRTALDGEPDAGGLLAYNHVSGEPLAGLSQGRPLVVRAPDSRFTLANFMRAQVYGVFGTLALGMRVLDGEDVALDRVTAHGGLFRTAGVAQKFLAGALGTRVTTLATAGEGGAWGAALLAAFATQSAHTDLDAFLRERVFARTALEAIDPDPGDVRGFSEYLARYRAGLALEHTAVAANL